MHLNWTNERPKECISIKLRKQGLRKKYKQFTKYRKFIFVQGQSNPWAKAVGRADVLPIYGVPK